MNLPESTIFSWEELCRQFTVNFVGTCSHPGTEADLHAIQQQPGEMLRAFVQRFCHIRHTIPQITAPSVILAFRQGVRDEKMLEKLATHNITEVADLLSLADKCSRAAEGRA